MSDPSGILRQKGAWHLTMTPREYIETLAQELGRVCGNGLLLSPADAQLALAWHAAQVPLEAVVREVRRAARLTTPAARGAAQPRISLHAIAPAIQSRMRARPKKAAALPTALAAQLRSAARSPGLAA